MLTEQPHTIESSHLNPSPALQAFRLAFSFALPKGLHLEAVSHDLLRMPSRDKHSTINLIQQINRTRTALSPDPRVHFGRIIPVYPVLERPLERHYSPEQKWTKDQPHQGKVTPLTP